MKTSPGDSEEKLKKILDAAQKGFANEFESLSKEDQDFFCKKMPEFIAEAEKDAQVIR